MFSKLAALSTFALLAVAMPSPTPQTTQCNTGAIQCCNSVQSSSLPSVASALGLLGIVTQGANVPIGVSCSPINVVGAGSGANCNASPVCCSNNTFHGLLAIGCTPINLSL